MGHVGGSVAPGGREGGSVAPGGPVGRAGGARDRVGRPGGGRGAGGRSGGGRGAGDRLWGQRDTGGRSGRSMDHSDRVRRAVDRVRRAVDRLGRAGGVVDHPDNPEGPGDRLGRAAAVRDHLDSPEGDEDPLDRAGRPEDRLNRAGRAGGRAGRAGGGRGHGNRAGGGRTSARRVLLQPDNPMEFLGMLENDPVSFGNYRDRQQHGRVATMMDEFLEYQGTVDSTKDWTKKETWEECGDPLGRILSLFGLWAVWKRVPTISLLTLMAKDIRNAYTEAVHRFPGWTDIVDAAVGVQHVKRTSQVYKASLHSLNRIFINRTADVQRAYPMFLSDLRRFKSCMAPTPNGFRDIALLYTLHETSARGIAFTQPYLRDPEYDEETERWTIYYQAQKRRGTEMTVRACVLSVEASEVFGLFWACRDAVDWKHPETLFGIFHSEDISRILEDLCLRAGYPNRFFSSHSARAGALTNEICQSMLDGSGPGVAQLNAKVMGDFGVNSDALRSYIRPMADRVKMFVGRRGKMEDITVKELHPELNNVLHGPFRKTRLSKGLDLMPWVMDSVRTMVDMLRETGDKHSSKLYSPKAVIQTKNTSLLNHLAKRLQRVGLLHPDIWVYAVKAAPKKEKWVYLKYCGRVLKLMVMIGDLTPGMLEAPAQVAVPSPTILQHLYLPPVPTKYRQPKKPMGRFNVGASTNVKILATGFKNRKRKRATPNVFVGRKVYHVTELSPEQLHLLQEAQANRTSIDPAVFEAVGEAEDAADFEVGM